MNPAVNRSSELPPSSDNQPLKPDLPTRSDSRQNDDSQNNTQLNPTAVNKASPSEQPAGRKQPIPHPSDPRQYRAIGLIKGQYKPSQEQLTQGALLTEDGTTIEAVLLGRTISLVKNHLDLEKPHLWVVYPRTRQKDDHLHVQIVGVWEPETLDRNNQTESNDSQLASDRDNQHGYFSIRGEVVFYSQDSKVAIVKIRQSAKKESEKPKFFKLKLQGDFPEKPLGHFWDLQVKLQGNALTIDEATDIGLLRSKKKPFRKKPGKKRPPIKRGDSDTPRKSPANSRPIPKPKKADVSKPSPSRPISKAIKRPNKKNNT
ncbi:MAG: hypothetical protein QNJ54_08830 [Prochloraceae cyanobacterium]|nr:hypothetical protein [Prochloraceae cyanobacterium]